MAIFFLKSKKANEEKIENPETLCELNFLWVAYQHRLKHSSTHTHTHILIQCHIQQKIKLWFLKLIKFEVFVGV